MATFLIKQYIHILFKTVTSLSKIRIQRKSNEINKPGVYKLTRGSCRKVYTDQSGRFLILKAYLGTQTPFINVKTDSKHSEHFYLEIHYFNENFEKLQSETN